VFAINDQFVDGSPLDIVNDRIKFKLKKGRVEGFA
jgi:hypothetical protein